MPGTPVQEQVTESVDYTSIDLNADATTDILDPSVPTLVRSVHMQNDGTTNIAQLEITDGSSTAVLDSGTAQQGAGDNISFSETIVLTPADKLQVNVTTVEGGAQTNTAVVTSEKRD